MLTSEAVVIFFSNPWYPGLHKLFTSSWVWRLTRVINVILVMKECCYPEGCRKKWSDNKETTI